MKLPEKITDWHHILNLFSPVVQGHLLSVLRPLSGFFQPILSDVDEGIIEPDGIDGISNKGHYQDLLLSEWALLDEIPDEFERRFVMGEHLFLNKKKTEKNKQKLSIVLFDVGPAQFGSPKLGQLAVLLLMWRRAAQAGALFRFGALQSNRWLNEFQLDQEGIKKLLNTHHSNFADDSNFEYWNSELTSLDTDTLELWIVSTSKLDKIEGASGFVAINEKPFSTFPQLEVSSITARNKTKSQIIRLPEGREQIQILRHPFEISAPSRVNNKGDVRFSFSTNGRRSLRLNNQGELYINVLPKKTSRNVKKTQTLNLGEQIIAVGTAKNEVIRLIKTESGYRIIGLPKQAAVDFGSNQSLTIDKRRFFDSIQYIGDYHSGRSILFLDSKHKLRKLDLTNENRQLITIEKNVCKLGRVNSIHYFIQYQARQLVVTMYIERAFGIRQSFSLGAYRNPKIFIHDSGSWSSRSVGCIAYQLSSDSWKVASSLNSESVLVDTNAEVFGALMTEHSDRVPGLLVVSASRKNISLIYNDTSKVIIETEDIISKAYVNPTSQSFAYRTNTEVWRLYSIEHQQILLDIG